MNRWKLLAAAIGIAIVSAASAIGVDAALNRSAGLTTGGGTGIELVRIATQDAAFVTNSTTFVTVPGAAVNIPVSSGETVVVTADFTAETACYPSPQTGSPSSNAAGQPGTCAGRIMIGGLEGYPASGMDFAFDSTDAGTEGSTSWEGHAFSRSRRITNTSDTKKNYSVFVQVAVGDASTSFSVDDYHLRVMSISNGTGL